MAAIDRLEQHGLEPVASVDFEAGPLAFVLSLNKRH